MAIKLNSIDQIPHGILRKLESFKEVFKGQESWEQCVAIPSLLQITMDLDQVCQREGIIGYHYTRAEKESIARRGLVVLSGDQRRQEFLERHGHRFAPAQRDRILDKWKQFFLPNNCKSRDYKLFFNFTFNALAGGGAEHLLTYYGGEAVYFPLCDDSEIGEILKTIGQPMIVECALDAEDVSTYYEYPWGKIWLSSYHAMLNPSALRCDQDGTQRKAVPAEKVNCIHIIQPPFGYREFTAKAEASMATSGPKRMI